VSPQGKAGTGTTITVHSTPIGAAVAGPPSRPRTLYELGSDSKTRSTCNSGCAGTWPPLVTTGRPHAGAGITASLITTLVRNNGTRQVVYNGHPLYYFSGDSAAGQDNGQCITYPALWTVLTKAGRDNKTGCSATAAQCSPRPTNGVVSTATKGSLGTILVDSKGCTLYEYTRDLQNTTTSTCTSSCATAWPPMMASGAPTAQGSAQSGLLNKTSSGQVTYNGHPLYYYTGDGNSSQATGQGFNESYVPPNYYYFYAMRANGSHA
jgi:predicted lipoprotein with Yx(FWY)xxD motif